MQMMNMIPVSISGQRWCWRGDRAGTSGQTLNPDDLVAQLLLSRGCPREETESYRTPTIRHFMPDPAIFQDMEKAAIRMANAIEKGEKVTIYGDYDVDGATSAALLIRLLRSLGLEAGYYIPDRLMEGYGPGGPALVKLSEQGSTLIVTVDCGAQAFEALGMARDVGVDVIVVDHHKCAAELPPALALVNPNRLDEAPEAAAFGHLAAVGVAFLLGAALIRELRRRGWFESRLQPNLMELLDLVALGTVADVAQLRGLNRAFVTQGLRIMAKQGNIGLSALAQASRLTRAPLCHDLGFALGPRINAGGRVGKSDLGVRLLTTQDEEEARIISAELDQFNEERRAIESLVQEEAQRLAEEQLDAPVILVSGEGWHPGVIGIVAGRLKEKYGKPTIVIATDEDGIGKGSGRSISGVDLGAAILSAKDMGHLVAGGGHAMAAGLTVEVGKIEGLRTFLNDRLARPVETARADRALLVDAMLSPRGVNPDLVRSLEEGGPYGAGWPSPRIVTGPARIIKADVVGNGHVRLVVAGADGSSLKAVGFRMADSILGQELLNGGKDRQIWLAGRAKIDDWGGGRTAELHMDDAAWAN